MFIITLTLTWCDLHGRVDVLSTCTTIGEISCFQQSTYPFNVMEGGVLAIVVEPTSMSTINEADLFQLVDNEAFSVSLICTLVHVEALIGENIDNHYR